MNKAQKKLLTISFCIAIAVPVLAGIASEQTGLWSVMFGGWAALGVVVALLCAVGSTI